MNFVRLCELFHKIKQVRPTEIELLRNLILTPNQFLKMIRKDIGRVDSFYLFYARIIITKKKVMKKKANISKETTLSHLM